MSIDARHINVILYKPLEGSSYIQLPAELRNSNRGLVNIKNEDNECFRWCHIRCLNPQEKNPQRIIKSDREVLLQLDYDSIEFPVSVKDHSKLEWRNINIININVFSYKNKQFYPIYVSKEHNEDVLNLLLITKDEKKHVLIKDFNSLMFIRPSTRRKSIFACTVSNVLAARIFSSSTRPTVWLSKVSRLLGCHKKEAIN